MSNPVIDRHDIEAMVLREVEELSQQRYGKSYGKLNPQQQGKLCEKAYLEEVKRLNFNAETYRSV